MGNGNFPVELHTAERGLEGLTQQTSWGRSGMDRAAKETDVGLGVGGRGDGEGVGLWVGLEEGGHSTHVEPHQ